MITPVFGLITATNQTTPGPASAVTFTIAAQLAEGPVVLTGVKPANKPPADTWDVDATALVESWCIGGRHPDGRIRWIINLFPDAFDCPE